MSTPASGKPESHIRSLVDGWTEALRGKDVRSLGRHPHASAPFDPATGLALVITPASALAPGRAGRVQSRAAT